MALLKKKSDDPEVAALQEKIDHMEGLERVRRKYGRISDRDAEAYLKDEERAAKKAEMRRVAEEEGRKAREERDKLIRKTAREYIANGRIIAAVEGSRVETIGNDLSFACPDCGGALRDDQGLLIRLTEMHLFAPPQRFAEPSELVIYSARNPLGAIIGFPGTLRPMACTNCGKSSLVIMQLVVI